MIGQVIGNYVIVSELGKGGMGMVYRAEHTKITRTVALKILLPAHSADPETVQRFFVEARAASSIDHPGIVEIFDFGIHDGRAYLVMELLSGQSLGHLLQAGALTPFDAGAIIGQIVSVIAAAHARGIVHRDLKPDHIVLEPSEEVPGGLQVKLLDFGIAKMIYEQGGAGPKTQTGVMIGTPAYMSPEQCMGKSDVDHRTDLYAIGCILFHMLCGRAPFSSEHGTGMLIAAHLRDAPPDPKAIDSRIPSALAAITLRLLEKDPAARFQTALEVRAALVAAGVNIATTLQRPATPSIPPRMSTPPVIVAAPNEPTIRPQRAAGMSKRNAAIIGGLAFLAAGTCVFAIVSYATRKDAPAESAAAGGTDGTASSSGSGAPGTASSAAASSKTASSAAPGTGSIAGAEAASGSASGSGSGSVAASGSGSGSVAASGSGSVAASGSGAGSASGSGSGSAAGSVTASGPVTAPGTSPASGTSAAPGTSAVSGTSAAPGAGASGSGASGSGAAANTASAPGSGSVAAAEACTTGQVRSDDTRGHCCWPAQAWSSAKAKCVGAPACPTGFRAGREDCVEAKGAVAASPTVEPAVAPAISLGARTYAPGAKVQITFAQPISSAEGNKAFVTIAAAENPRSSFEVREMVPDRARSLTLTAPTEHGDYEVRLFTNYPKENFKIARVAGFVVGSAEASPKPVAKAAGSGETPRAQQRFTAPTNAVAGTKLVMRFPVPLHALEGEQFWVKVVKAGESAKSWGRFDYLAQDASSATLVLPNEPGDYELELNANYPTKKDNTVFRTKLRIDPK